MSNRAQAHYLRIYNGGTTYQRWQSYYVNQSVTHDSATWTYFPFVANGLMASSASGSGGISIEVPATKAAIDAFTPAVSRGYLCEVKVYEFDSRKENDAPQGSQTTIVNFVGECVGMSGTFTSLTIDLGSSLAPVGSQTPPRRFTTYQVGAPIRL
tara:strand:- start:3502 stop:3966 length:465 start_codon:yes stop_codon:yes gene_type:complete